MAETRKWLRCAGNSSDSLAKDSGTEIRRGGAECPLYPISTFLVSDLDRPFCHPQRVTSPRSPKSTPMHHLMSMGSSAASAEAGLAGGRCRDAEQGLRP